MTNEFRIIVGDASKSFCDAPGDPPEDDPDDLDMYLWRFCYERNRRIGVRVGTDELKAELDPDIRIMWLGLPKMVSGLERGEKDSLGFSERGSEVTFVPEGDIMWCHMLRGGEGSHRRPLACNRAQVINELWRFLDGLTGHAVAEGYLNRTQAKDLLGHDLPSEGASGMPTRLW